MLSTKAVVLNQCDNSVQLACQSFLPAKEKEFDEKVGDQNKKISF